MSASPTPPSRDRYNAAERLLEPNLPFAATSSLTSTTPAATYADLADELREYPTGLIAREQRVPLAPYDTIDPDAFWVRSRPASFRSPSIRC
jgi:hypothetical protein